MVSCLVDNLVDNCLVDYCLVDKCLVDNCLVDNCLVDNCLVGNGLVDNLVDNCLVGKELSVTSMVGLCHIYLTEHFTFTSVQPRCSLFLEISFRQGRFLNPFCIPHTLHLLGI